MVLHGLLHPIEGDWLGVLAKYYDGDPNPEADKVMKDYLKAVEKVSLYLVRNALIPRSRSPGKSREELDTMTVEKYKTYAFRRFYRAFMECRSHFRKGWEIKFVPECFNAVLEKLKEDIEELNVTEELCDSSEQWREYTIKHLKHILDLLNETNFRKSKERGCFTRIICNSEARIHKNQPWNDAWNKRYAGTADVDEQDYHDEMEDD